MPVLSRRDFLRGGTLVLASAAPAAGGLWPFGSGKAPGGGRDIRGRIFRGDAPDAPGKYSREGFLYKRMDGGQVVCGICPHRCLLAPGDRSVCRSRVNIEGTLYSLAYGNPCAVHLDPVEKKPLYHFLPTSRAFSLAAAGCNLRCLNCQNWEISQRKPSEVRHVALFPAQAVAAAGARGAASIAYTYSEPVTFFEYTRDTARLAREKGIKNLLISAGYINREPLLELCRWIDGANINLKSFSDEVYRRLNGARLDPVLETFRTLHEQRVHFEMTHLVVPGYVDDEKMFKGMCAWIIENLGPDHPLHITRFFPRYKLDRLAPTPVSILSRFRDLALAAGIRYVYVGNVPGHDGGHTYCHRCRRVIVRRRGYVITAYELENGHCRFCQTKIPGVWPTGG